MCDTIPFLEGRAIHTRRPEAQCSLCRPKGKEDCGKDGVLGRAEACKHGQKARATGQQENDRSVGTLQIAQGGQGNNGPETEEARQYDKDGTDEKQENAFRSADRRQSQQHRDRGYPAKKLAEAELKRRCSLIRGACRGDFDSWRGWLGHGFRCSA